ncbi:SCO family protein [Streptomyces sp. NPDC000151]|uniref:SCO family protein n=1 Tax=Streptomyces sp. NPDC000151 TaxID=3154244 RepID=UPI003321493C
MRRTPKLAAAALVAVAALTLTACGSDSGGDEGAPAASVSGAQSKPIVTLDDAMEKPDLVLTDTDGKKYDLIKETKGRPTLIYFGYTHCPDACPAVMGNIDVARKQLPEAEQKKLRIVFVTTDPKRDTPERLKSWLNGFGADIVGLTGDFATIQGAASSVNVGISKPEKKKNGDILVDHGLQVLLASPKDDRIHWLGMKDAGAEDYAHALPKIIKGQNP